MRCNFKNPVFNNKNSFILNINCINELIAPLATCRGISLAYGHMFLNGYFFGYLFRERRFNGANAYFTTVSTKNLTDIPDYAFFCEACGSVLTTREELAAIAAIYNLSGTTGIENYLNSLPK